MNSILWTTFAVLTAVGAQDPTQVAFSAGLTHHLVLAGNENIVYDKVFVNIGNGYNNQNGIFTAPAAGTYVFQFHGMSKSNEIMYLELYHNYKYVASAYSHHDYDWASGGNNVVIHIDKGDTVNVKDMQYQDSQLYGMAEEIYCTFSGYLIVPYQTETSVVG